MPRIVLAFVFIISTSGLIYELIAGTAASYLLGDSVTQFSTVIGVYLFAMGVGSYFTRYVKRRISFLFVQTQILVGLIGGSAAAVLFLSFEFVASFRVLLYALVFVTGTLVGFEIPLLMRLLKRTLVFRDLVSRVFALDYVGALLAALLFPLFIVPALGLIRGGFLFGFLNTLVALVSTYVLPGARTALLRGQTVFFLLLQAAGFASSDHIMRFAESLAYHDTIIYAHSSSYQRLVLTAREGEMRLFLNGNLQFSSRDEYRYHESLVHPLLASLDRPSDVLVLGGGDGLAAREILKYPGVNRLVLVDLDPAMTGLFSRHAELRRLNQDSLNSPRIQIVNEDAFVWLKSNSSRFDAIVVDFPDPSSFTTGKLYTLSMYRLLSKAMKEDGALVIQSTSPYFAPRSFWIVEATLRSAGFVTLPYHAYVPSFGEWGFILASRAPLADPVRVPENLKFFTVSAFEQMKYFPSDMRSSEQAVNRLNNQILVRTFEEEWSRFGQR